MVVLLSSYLTIDIDSDQGIPVYWPSSGVSTYLIALLLQASCGTSCGDWGWTDRVYCSQDRKHRPGWHYLRMLLRLVFCLLVRISLYCPAGFPPWPEGRGSAGAQVTGVASLQSESAGWCAAGRCGKSAWLMQPHGANEVLPSSCPGCAEPRLQ